jgi:hypothetical protein
LRYGWFGRDDGVNVSGMIAFGVNQPVLEFERNGLPIYSHRIFFVHLIALYN